jgi:hypothetical protein
MLTIGKESSPTRRAIAASRTCGIFANRTTITALKRIVQTAFLTCTGVALVACGGGGAGTGGTPPVNVVVPGPSVAASQGVITAKGSVFVNGIEYITNIATIIKIDDIVVNESELKVGMVVKVRGTTNDVTRKGTVTQLEARDILEGTIPISGVDTLNKTISVMGQTVKIEDNVTRLNDDNLQTVTRFVDANYQPGDIVEVHGFADDKGGVRATRVLRKAPGTGEFESKGFVTGLGTSSTSFVLSLTTGGTTGLTVNFGSLPPGTVDGSFVQVKSALAPVAGAVTATLIRLESKLGAAGENVEVEGIVSSGTLANFVINGQRVFTNGSTLFEGGLSSDFAVGVKLDAEGPLVANGADVAIAATKISFRSNIIIETGASAVSATGLTVLGRPVVINQFTQIGGNGILQDGRHVEVRAFRRPDDGELIATRIVVQSDSATATVQGLVTDADKTAGTLTILGNAIFSDAFTTWRVSSTLGEPFVSKADFFDKLKINPNVVVKVKWNPFNSVDTSPIREAEIELGK